MSGGRLGPLIALAGLVLVLGAVSIGVGRSGIPIGSLLEEIAAGDLDTAYLIVVEIRLPRTILAALLGASLGLGGAALQGYLRNPLAEPGLVGASSTAALGAVLMLYFGVAAIHPVALPLGGVLGGLVGLTLVMWLGRGASGVLSLILAGVAINTLAGALTALALNFAPNPYAALEMVFWLLGSLADRSFDHVHLTWPFMLAGWMAIGFAARGLDALSLGEDTAASLGFDPARIRLLVVLGVGLCAGAGVAVAGSVGFVGLVVPHLLRPLARHRPARLLPFAALGGAALTLAADITVRLLPGPTELKLGVLTALVGAPFFLHLIARTRSEPV